VTGVTVTDRIIVGSGAPGKPLTSQPATGQRRRPADGGP